MDSNQIKATMSKSIGKDISELTDDAQLNSLVQDSFMLVELVMTLQEDLGVMITQEDLKDVKTVGQLIEVFTAKA